MTIRLYIAMFYAIAALGVAALPDLTGNARAAKVFAATIEPAHQGRAVDLFEIEPGLSGHPEDDDMPAYMTAGAAGGHHAD
ncbi:MAG: hypothetical protein AAF666_06910 [Pseudomonadota bacterium]